jgi:DNA-binding transcriptional regulator YiaG
LLGIRNTARSINVHAIRELSAHSTFRLQELTGRKTLMSGLLDEVAESLSLPSPAKARAIREAAGVSQTRMAQELGRAPLTIHRWETGATVPTGEQRIAYARLLRDLDQAVRAAHGEAA